jgi:xanthine dehydrogenase molybdopterin-binding subunit B
MQSPSLRVLSLWSRVRRLTNIRLKERGRLRSAHPGGSIGTFALESAADELAAQMGIDPIELRVRNEPDKDPASGKPFSSRNIVKALLAPCLQRSV